jgi:hypothetical protein
MCRYKKNATEGTKAGGRTPRPEFLRYQGGTDLEKSESLFFCGEIEKARPSEQPGGSGSFLSHHPTIWALETHMCICLLVAGPGRPHRSPPDSAHSGPPLCCAGSAGSCQTRDHSCPRHWDPRSHCTDTGGRAGGVQKVPMGPQKSHRHSSRSAALHEKGAGVRHTGQQCPKG